MAWRVLRRNPFFTGISLFGISFTLAVLMLMVAYLNNQFGANTPLSHADDLIYFRQLEQKQVNQDTIWSVDSSLVNGLWVLDSTYQNVDNNNWTSRSGFHIDFLAQFFSKEKLTTVETITYMSGWGSYDVFHNNKKYQLSAKHIDEKYFEVFDFKILQGRVFNKADIDQAALHVVITDALGRDYFGSIDDVVGKIMHVDHKDFMVIGIISKANVNNSYIDSDIFMPISYLNPDEDRNGYFGGYAAVAKSKDVEATLEEIKKITATIPFLDPSQSNGANFNRMRVIVYDHLHLNTNDFFYSDDPKESKGWFKWIVGGIILLFCLVPLLNLINLNVSRILDRSSEIGVRKAFGAHASHILVQIIFENVVLTLLGGIIGALLALLLMYLINKNAWLEELKLGFNLSVFMISFLLVIFFGILSGILPAYKIAKSHIVHALKYK